MSAYPGGNKTRFLEETARLVQHVKEDSYRLMRVGTGDRVLDLGCGPATDTIALGKIVGEQGLVIGIDLDDQMIALANQKAAKASVSGWVQHQLVDATKLPFEDSYFDACHSERLFQHLTEPVTVLKEMVRVTKPGGRIVISDADYPNSGAINTRYLELMWRIRRYKADRHKMGYVALQLYPLMKACGLEVEVEFYTRPSTSYQLYRYLMDADAVEAELQAAGMATDAELQQYNNELQDREAVGTLYWAWTMETFVGRKPAQ